jgi:hypothetical protein
MWTSLAFAASLLSFAPGAEALKFSNVRFTYCKFGMERTDTKFLPGDILNITYDIENLAIDKKTRKVVYSLDLEVLDANNKRVFKRANSRIEETNTLLSTSQQGYATLVVGKDQPPGKYTLKVTVKDGITNQEASFKREFEVLKERLGIIRVNAPVVNIVGPPFGLSFYVVGFGKEKKGDKKLPNFEVEVNILNEKGEPMLRKPEVNLVPRDLADDIKPEEATEIPVSFGFFLNRVGKYTIVVKVTDKTTKKDPVEMKYKITILDIKKFE